MFPRQISEIDQLEKIQKRFTKRLLYPRFSHEYLTRLGILNLVPVEIMLIKISLLFLFKVRVGVIALPRIALSSPIRTVTLCNSVCLDPPRCNTELHHGFFPHNVLAIWNSLPGEVTVLHSISRFRQSLDHIDFSRCVKGVL